MGTDCGDVHYHCDDRVWVQPGSQRDTYQKDGWRIPLSAIFPISFSGDDYDTPGLAGALTHMVCHALMKICSFFCVGAVIHRTGKTLYMNWMVWGKKMPVVFGLFTVSALALMGVPGLCGFISKWNLAQAAAESGGLSLVGMGALLVSALLTAIYMLTIVVRAFFPAADFSCDTLAEVKDADWYMLLPLFLFAAAMLVWSVFHTIDRVFDRGFRRSLLGDKK